MSRTSSRLLLSAAVALSLSACGGGGGASMAPSSSAPQAGTTSANVPVIISDASTEDWATIGVKVLSLALIPAGGGDPVTIYTAPAATPTINLAQLDDIGDVLGNLSVPTGTYTGATLTISANPGDVQLVAAADPEAGFAAAPGAAIPAAQIQIQGAQGNAPNLTVPIHLKFAAQLVVSDTAQTNLDLEFDLAHPAFITAHNPPGANALVWAVNFNGPVHHHRLADLRRLVLRHMYGNVTAVAADASSITIARDEPALPVQNPETAVPTGQSLQILADATNGTFFYDVDAHTRTTIKDFSAESTSLPGKYVRVAARYQENGTLVATRVWASSSFSSVWLSPEGHVVHVDATNDVIAVQNESGQSVSITIGPNTAFFFRTPQDALADATPIATGTGFLAAHNLVRGFKVHVSVEDPLATPLLAQTIDIETARYEGRISAADSTNYVQSANFRTAGDDYSVTLPYIANATPNGTDAGGSAIDGFKWWNFAYPTLINSGEPGAISAFAAATNGAVNFGGSIGALSARGVSYEIWNDPANPGGWSTAAAILTPTPLPLGQVANGLVNGVFTMTLNGGTQAVNVDLSVTSGSATLVYQIDRTGGIVTVSPIDVTTSSGLATVTGALVSGARVKVYGVPQADGSIKAYVLSYYTGEQPAG